MRQPLPSSTSLRRRCAFSFRHSSPRTGWLCLGCGIGTSMVPVVPYRFPFHTFPLVIFLCPATTLWNCAVLAKAWRSQQGRVVFPVLHLDWLGPFWSSKGEVGSVFTVWWVRGTAGFPQTLPLEVDDISSVESGDRGTWLVLGPCSSDDTCAGEIP